jgi:hypothetical protein
MSPRAATTVLLCAFALALISSWGHVRVSQSGNALGKYWFESDESEQSERVQHDNTAATVPSFWLELAPEFARSVEGSKLDIDALVRVAVLNRGPPSLDS